MRVLNTFRPTLTQKQALAKIASAATPTVAGDSVSIGQNMVAARDTLVKLGLITFNSGEASLTDAGNALAAQENIVDDSGGLTDQGQQLAQSGVSENFAALKELLR